VFRWTLLIFMLDKFFSWLSNSWGHYVIFQINNPYHRNGKNYILQIFSIQYQNFQLNILESHNPKIQILDIIQPCITSGNCDNTILLFYCAVFKIKLTLSPPMPYLSKHLELLQWNLRNEEKIKCWLFLAR